MFGNNCLVVEVDRVKVEAQSCNLMILYCKLCLVCGITSLFFCQRADFPASDVLASRRQVSRTISLLCTQYTRTAEPRKTTAVLVFIYIKRWLDMHDICRVRFTARFTM